MDRILIVTAHTGYNYGTYLQAYAMKCFLKNFVPEVDIVWQKTYGPNGRDYRFEKIVKLCIRTLFNYKQAKKIKQGYQKNFEAEPTSTSKEMFDEFAKHYLDVKEFSKRNLKKLAFENNTKAVVCGSDQIWNAATLYPDPLYYLQFVPKSKRIAYAASFGRSEIPNYNLKIIAKYLKTIPQISVREDSGARIINRLMKKNVPVVPDPTLIVDWSKWICGAKEDYMLVYFLDDPKDDVLQDILCLQKKMDIRIKVLLHKFECYKIFKNIDLIDAGPKEFIEYVSKASFVCTDSFHATIFSIISETQFYTYERNYGSQSNQGTRLKNLLEHYNLSERMRKLPCNSDMLLSEINFEKTKSILANDKQCAFEYMTNALVSVQKLESEK